MQKTYYWSLAITAHFAAACLWSRDDKDETSIVTFGPEIAWENDDELVAAVDSSLSEVTAHMPEDAGEPTKTVFGVMGSWVSEGHIKKGHLALIREICGKLSLSPVGFVVLPEALANEVKQNEGGPLSGLLVGVLRSTLEVTLFKLGNPAGTVEVGRSVSLSEDLIEALSRFSSNDPLPSRVVLYGASADELLDISHLLSSVNWKGTHEKLQFLHEPKIEIADSERCLTAVCVAGSSEMGPIKSIVLPEKETEASEVEESVVSTDVSLNDLGFAMNADISEISRHSHKEPIEEATMVDEDEPDDVVKRVSPLLLMKKKILSFIPKKHAPQLPIERQSMGTRALSPGKVKRMGIMSGVFAAILFGVFFAAWFALPKADITIFISPRTLTSRETFILKEDASTPDVNGRVLPSQVFTKTVSNQDSAPATGAKTVGEAATGKVTVRNGTSSDVKLPAGALLVGPNDLKFTITESASVSAATSPTSPGTATIPATAAAIGPDYNLSADTSLKVGNFSKSEIDAVVSEAFTGGSSRQITAVSKTDLDTLERTLTDKLMTQAQEEMVSEVPDDALFISNSITTRVTSKTFDHKVGDEAAQVGLNLEVEATAYTVPKTAITEAAASLLETQVPSGYSFRPEQVQTSFELQKGATEPTAIIGFTAYLLPNVNPDDVARAVSGKRFTAANDYLGTIPGFVKASITITPAFPNAIRFVPFRASQISVSIEAEK